MQRFSQYNIKPSRRWSHLNWFWVGSSVFMYFLYVVAPDVCGVLCRIFVFRMVLDVLSSLAIILLM